MNILCYGQSESGKAHTMIGDVKDPVGILQQSLETIFAFVEFTPEKEFLIRLSYFEIYNESIKDLLAAEKKNLQLIESKNVISKE